MPGLGLRVLELREVDPPGLVERVAGGTEALPERRFGLAVELGAGALQGLPLIQQRAHASAAGLPLDLGLRLPSDGLSLEDELFALGPAGLSSRAALGSFGGLLGINGFGDLDEPCVQLGKVTDDVSIGGLLAELDEPIGGLPCGHLGVRHALQQEISRGEQLVILAREVGQRLGMTGAGVGTHLSFTVGGADEDRA